MARRGREAATSEGLQQVIKRDSVELAQLVRAKPVESDTGDTEADRHAEIDELFRTAAELVKLLEPLNPEDQRRALNAARALLDVVSAGDC